MYTCYLYCCVFYLFNVKWSQAKFQIILNNKYICTYTNLLKAGFIILSVTGLPVADGDDGTWLGSVPDGRYTRIK